MTAVDPEAIARTPLVDQTAENAARELLEFAAAQHDQGVINSEQLRAIGVLVGSQAINQTILGLHRNEGAELELNDELQVEQLRLRRELGHTALHAVEPAPAPSPASEDDAAAVAPPSPIVPTEPAASIQTAPERPNAEPIEPATQNLAGGGDDSRNLELEGVSARVAIERYLRTQPNGLFDKGSMRSAGSRLAEELAVYGHSKAAVNQALPRLVEDRVIELSKPTPAAKIVNSIRLLDTTDLVESVSKLALARSAPLPFRDQPKKPVQSQELNSAGAEIDPAKLDEFTAQFTGKAIKGYLAALKAAKGNISASSAQDVLLDSVRELANKSLPEGDSKLSDSDILKAQRALIDIGVIETGHDDEAKPARVTAIRFSASALTEIVKKND